MAIQQHPVPQDISNYKFRLIGDMTIKQFAALGISIVLSVMTYSAPLPFFFKYPISFILLLLGVGTAFVPFQGRTLDVWIVAFIKSIYSPTQYIWKHGQETPVTTADNSTPQTPIVPVSPPAADTTEVTPQTTAGTESPSLGLDSSPSSTNIVPDAQTDSLEINNLPQPAPSPTPTPEIPVPQTSPVPETQTIQSPTEEINNGNNSHNQPLTNIEPQPAVNDQSPTTLSPSSLPIPFTPTTPNTLVGLTLTPNGQTLDGVLVEIKNQNITMRATKSNKLGQFLFVRPLENGLYQILAEKDGFQFESYSIQLNGEIINPLRIQAIN